MYGSRDIKIEKIEKQICFWKGDEATFSGLKVTQIINHPQVKGNNNKKKILAHKADSNIVNLIIKLVVRGLYIETLSDISNRGGKGERKDM